MSYIDDSSANWRSNDNHRREDQKRLIIPLTKNPAKEEPIIAEGKEIIFPFHIYFYFLLLSNI